MFIRNTLGIRSSSTAGQRPEEALGIQHGIQIATRPLTPQDLYQKTIGVTFGSKPQEKPMTWNPRQYLSFENHRLRPALELMARIPLEAPQTIIDLGCGTGNVTKILHERWPQAKVTGVDSSQEMLKAAKTSDTSAIIWQKRDMATWKPRGKVDLLFSNAALHWLGDHETLFPQLMHQLKRGGILAVQMPRNFDAPSHTLMMDIAKSGPWAERLSKVLRQTPVMVPSRYYEILAPHSSRVDIWETQYLQALKGENPVAEWTKGTWLKPLLDALEEPLRGQFEAEYRRRIREAYPPSVDGVTLFPFKRLFIMAQAKEKPVH